MLPAPLSVHRAAIIAPLPLLIAPLPLLIARLLLLIAPLLLLTACSADEPAPAPVVPVSPEPFVAAVQRQLPQVAVDRRDEEVAALGEQTCASPAAGHDEPAVLAQLRDQGLSEPDARTLLTLAEESACRP